jgi:glycosyltransferase involved in cell wall biosynthesis
VRVLLITDWLPGVGGAERYITGVRDGLRAAGDEVRLLTSSAGTAGDGSADYRAFGSEHVAARMVLQIVNPFAIAAVRRALGDFRPDVALVNMFENQLSPAILGQLRGVPTVLSVTDYKGICPISSKLLPSGRLCHDPAGAVCWRSGCVNFPHWLRDQPRYALIRAERRHVARILACSRWVQRELALSGIESEHLTLPVPPAGPNFRRVPAPRPMFVYCGRLDHTKGLPLLLHAFARLLGAAPTALLRIVGAGPQREMLERLVQSLGLRNVVTFRGRVQPSGVEHELADAWALVVPSLWAEPLGLVALEAIVRGIPVVASAAGGLGEIVEHGASGLLFSNGDEEELAGRLAAIASGAAFPAHALSDAVVRRATERHDPAVHIECLRGIFTSLVTHSDATPAAPPKARAPLHQTWLGT